MENLLNQHIPNYCGSCWAFATSSALGDRFKMARKAIFPEIFLSPQYLVNCITGSRGCDGGHHSLVYPYYSKNGGVDETCQNYQAKNLKCDAEGTCINCSPSKGCFPMGTPANQNNFTKYYVEQYGNIQKNVFSYIFPYKKKLNWVRRKWEVPEKHKKQQKGNCKKTEKMEI